MFAPSAFRSDGRHDGRREEYDSEAVCGQSLERYEALPSGEVAHDIQNYCRDSQRSDDRNEYNESFSPVIFQVA